MTQNETGHDILEKFRAELKRLDCSQSEAAKQIGISPSTLTQVLKGSYKADPQEILIMIEKWLKLVSLGDQALPRAPEWVQTQNAEKILATLRYGQMSSGIVLIYGAPGVGKTTACKAYKKQYPNVWISTASAAHNSVSAALGSLALAIGLKEFPHRAAQIELETINAIKGSQGLVIIDEAQNLNPQALDTLRIIGDLSGVGFAFVGNERAYTRLQSGKEASYLNQFNGRLATKLGLFKIPKEDIETISKAFGIQNKDALKRLCQIGQGQGGLRAVSNVLRLASLNAGLDIPDLSHIESAIQNLGL